jgi:hypothetical protein
MPWASMKAMLSTRGRRQRAALGTGRSSSPVLDDEGYEKVGVSGVIVGEGDAEE